MTNTELTRIREDRQLSKSDLAKELGITPMLLGKYEKGTVKIPDEIAAKVKESDRSGKKSLGEAVQQIKETAKEVASGVKASVGDQTVASQIEVKKNTRKAARKAKEVIEGAASAVKKAVADQAAATGIEVKKNTRKTVQKIKEAAEKATSTVKDAVDDQAAAAEIEVKKKTRKAGRKAKEAADTVKETAGEVKKSTKSAVGFVNIIIQSPMGGVITPAEIHKKVPKDTKDVYVRVDDNKLYYVLKNGEIGNVDIWE